MEINYNEIPDSVNHGWIKTDNYSYHFRNPNFINDEEYSSEFLNRLKDLIESNPGNYPKLKRRSKNKSDDNLLIINPADVHLGKRSTTFSSVDDYNSEIAKSRVNEGIKGIIDKSSGFNINKILFIAGNDILHTEGDTGKTSNGTKQDLDKLWYENFLDAFDLYVKNLESLITISDVHYIFCPSNHDRVGGFSLSNMVAQYFRLNKNITFDVDLKHRKYYKHGNNLLGFTHADSGRVSDLPLLMAHDEPEYWAKCNHRYFYTHHVHHKFSKDHMSVNIESMRSPSGSDQWHHQNGYDHNIKAIEGFIHSGKGGKIASFNHIF
jgi:hypothetical protein